MTQISTIIQDEAGEDAEIIFGAVHDPSLEGKVRVTVIATGFPDGMEDENVIRPDFRRASRQHQKPATHARSQVRPMPQPARKVAVGGGSDVLPLGRLAERPDRVITLEQVGELDIPTFIRRQMD